MDLGRSWAPFGRVLGGTGTSLGRSWALLGRIFGIQEPTFFKHWSKIGSKRPSGSILAPFWEGLGKVWGGSGEGFGRICKLLATIWKDLKEYGESCGRVSNWTPALIRSASQYAGVLPSVVERFTSNKDIIL